MLNYRFWSSWLHSCNLCS
ncbi:UNVERIFIED_CONTAM: hypothetical protein GTU68_044166 [Idotea baltica]|nr:hypothetical protein [Idotea baltica]